MMPEPREPRDLFAGLAMQSMLDALVKFPRYDGDRAMPDVPTSGGFLDDVLNDERQTGVRIVARLLARSAYHFADAMMEERATRGVRAQAAERERKHGIDP